MKKIKIEDIVNGKIVESHYIDFKETFDLDDIKSKTNIVSDVVAFLNADGGKIIIGVAEKGGSFHSFKNIVGDVDRTMTRITSILSDNIDPKPFGIKTYSISDGSVSIICIDIEKTDIIPYQNRLNGSFHIRTGPKNRPLSRDEVLSLSINIEKYKSKVDEVVLQERNYMSSNRIMRRDQITLDICVVSSETFQENKKIFRPTYFNGGLGRMKVAPLFGENNPMIMGPYKYGHHADNGFQDSSSTANSRFSIRDDRAIFSRSINTLYYGNGSLEFDKTTNENKLFCKSLSSFIEEEFDLGPITSTFILKGLTKQNRVPKVLHEKGTISINNGLTSKYEFENSYKYFLDYISSILPYNPKLSW